MHTDRVKPTPSDLLYHRPMYLPTLIWVASVYSVWWLMQTLITDQVQIIRDHRMLNPKVNIYTSSPLLPRFRDHFRKSVRLEGRGWLQVNNVFWTDQGSRTSELTVVVTLCTRLHKSKPDSMEGGVGHPNNNPNRRAIWQLLDAGRRKDSFL